MLWHRAAEERLSLDLLVRLPCPVSFKHADVVKEANVREISESTVGKFLRGLLENGLMFSERMGYYERTGRGKHVVEFKMPPANLANLAGF